KETDNHVMKYNDLLKLSAQQRKDITRLQNQVRLLKQKLKRKAANSTETSAVVNKSSAVPTILNKLSLNSTLSKKYYDHEVKEFSMKLHFYSPKAYKYAELCPYRKHRS